MDIELPVTIERQPDYTTCGPDGPARDLPLLGRPDHARRGDRRDGEAAGRGHAGRAPRAARAAARLRGRHLGLQRAPRGPDLVPEAHRPGRQAQGARRGQGAAGRSALRPGRARRWSSTSSSAAATPGATSRRRCSAKLLGEGTPLLTGTNGTYLYQCSRETEKGPDDVLRRARSVTSSCYAATPSGSLGLHRRPAARQPAARHEVLPGERAPPDRRRSSWASEATTATSCASAPRTGRRASGSSGREPRRAARRPPRAPALTCEHGGNRIPREYAHLFRGARAVLASHRGWDPGALAACAAARPAAARPLLAHDLEPAPRRGQPLRAPRRSGRASRRRCRPRSARASSSATGGRTGQAGRGRRREGASRAAARSSTSPCTASRPSSTARSGTPTSRSSTTAQARRGGARATLGRGPRGRRARAARAPQLPLQRRRPTACRPRCGKRHPAVALPGLRARGQPGARRIERLAPVSEARRGELARARARGLRTQVSSAAQSSSKRATARTASVSSKSS